jgi:hypothetical protein
MVQEEGKNHAQSQIPPAAGCAGHGMCFDLPGSHV